MTLHAAEADTRDLVEELRRRVAGEVRFDKMSRVLYSTDASMYRIEPIGVVLPRSEDDVVAVVETANRNQVPVLPRGGGTSLAGQAVGRAVVIDFSKYMRDMLEVNAEEGWVRAQPGIILDELNEQLLPHGVQFAPDPSTSNRGNVGGALGNNSCGAHSIIYGKTVDNVREIRAVLSNGDVATFGPVRGEALQAKARGDSREAQVYRSLVEIGDAHRDEVAARFPNIQRRVSGYNLDELASAGAIDMARFVVGSEGTLLSITEAKLRVVPIPKARALVVLHFRGLNESMEATVLALELGPASVELVDSMIIRQARENRQYLRMADFIDGEPEAILMVEFAGDSTPELEAKLDGLDERMRRSGLSYSNRRFLDPADQAKVWAVRKAGLGLMMNVPGPAKPLPFVEDTAVSPELLPEYVRRFNEIVREHGTSAGYYGHASVGCLHIRPLIDLKAAEDVERMVSIAAHVSDLVLEFGGAMSGEHGDGLARSAWNEKMFGSRIYGAFRQVKQAFDPEGTMNPGKIVDAPSMVESLRVTPATRHLEISTGLDFTAEGGLGGAVEMCNGQGACRKLSGTMCPSYMVTRDEKHSTRGRANALRAAMTGALPVDSLTGERLYRVMDLCLECKACKAECPSNVDMAKLKYEFLDRYHRTNGYPLRSRIFANISTLSRLGSFFAPLSNWSLGSQPFRAMLEQITGIDSRREMPTFASQTFTQWFRARGTGSPTTAARGPVVLFPDTFTDYNHPELGRAAVAVLEHMGYEVVVPVSRCCGRPMLSNGMIDKARANARFNVETIYPLVRQGAKVVGLEPSCILSFRDDYLDLLENDHRARAVADSTMLIEEFVKYAVEQDGATLEIKGGPGKLMFHGHCHQKALVGTGPAMEVLRSVPGCEVEEIQSGCCGMAGSFGFEKEHYETSLKIAEQSLFGPIRSAEGDFQVVSEGISCRQQIQHGTGVRARHLVEVLAEAI
jgi:FAD/FMN-containing dehydrogenase/Fe-S oxidoreductase